MEKSDLARLCREAIGQGSVLLRNQDKTLPFTKYDTVSVFGRCQIDFYKSGTGSGGSVHVPYVHNLLDGFEILKSEGFDVPRLNAALVKRYLEWIKDNPFDYGTGEWASEPWFQKEMPLEKDFVRKMSCVSNKAVFVIGRTAGEDKDNASEEGSWLLTKDERECIKTVCDFFDDVVILFNVSNIMDTSWIDDPEFKGHIKTVLYVWQGGMEGGLGAADVLCGKQNPSGKMSDTIAYRLSDWPCAKNFGSAEDEVYAEDIFTGYRYFTTFAPDAVQFEFGFGLSYTDFIIEPGAVFYDGKDFSLNVKVTNTGKTAGMETVQLYAECPEGVLGKAKRVLCAYKKTPLLKAGESCEFKISFCDYVIASYDETGVTGFKSCYVLEDGEYVFYCGNSSVNVSECGRVNVCETKCVEQLSKCLAPERAFERLRADGKYEKVPLSDGELSKKVRGFYENMVVKPVPEALEGSANLITFPDVKKNPSLIDVFIAQLSDTELITLVRGEGMMSRKVTPGIASAFGGVSERLHDVYKVPVAGCADGPSGIRLDTGDEASLVPIGTLLACTWNDELVENIYSCVGEELEQKQIDLLLGPGCNIHRSPLNGRNFEYYSEDPLLSGKIAAAVVRGLNEHGVHGTVKHFACNNQESHRRTQNSCVSERALREIYLKPFEIAVKEGHARSVMTGYNGLNGHWCASNFDLTQSILRGEWGFNGIVMSDWWACMTDCIEGIKKAKPSAKRLSEMVRSRNNLFMVVPNDSADKDGLGDNIASSVKEGTLSRKALELCARDVILFLTDTNASRRPLGTLKKETTVNTVLNEAPQDALTYKADCTFPWDDKNVVCVYIAEEGPYNITGTFIKDGGDGVSQSITNLLLNGENIGAFSSRSTGGKPAVSTVSQPYLKCGWYKVELIHTKSGIKVCDITVRSDKRLPPNTEKDLADEI